MISHDTLIKILERGFSKNTSTRAPERAKPSAREIAIIMVQHVGDRYQLDEKVRTQILEKYNREEVKYLRICDWVINIKSDTIASIMATILREKIPEKLTH